MKIAIIGFGHIGSILSVLMLKNNHDVIGIDLNKKLLDDFKNNKEPINEPNLQKNISFYIRKKKLCLSSKIMDAKKADIILITVGTPLGKNNKPNLKQIEKVSIDLRKIVKKGQLIILKSTVLPGVTRNILYKNLKNKKKLYISFSPERIAEGNALNEISKIPVVVSGIDDVSLKKSVSFWKKLNIKTEIVPSLETAELSKLACNAWIDLNVALANDLAQISDQIGDGLDILEVIRASNTLKKGSGYVNILTPSVGVGGYCLTKDPIFLSNYLINRKYSNVFNSSRKVNDNMPVYSVKKLLKVIEATKFRNKLNSLNVLILGASFKSNSGDIRFTPAYKFISELKKNKLTKIKIYDPLIFKEDRKYFKEPFFENIGDAVEFAHIICILSSHNEITNLTPQIFKKFSKKELFIFDGRRYFTLDEIKFIKENNMNYIGIGR